MWWLAIQQSFETFETALPQEDQAPCNKMQVSGVFQRGQKESEYEEQKQLLKATTSSNVSALSIILRANCIAKGKKSLTIGEELILSAAKVHL